MKRCSKCRQIKNHSEFIPEKKSSDGLSCYCKNCRKEYGKKYYQEHANHLKRYGREYYIKHRRKALEYQKKYRQIKKMEKK